MRATLVLPQRRPLPGGKPLRNSSPAKSWRGFFLTYAASPGGSAVRTLSAKRAGNVPTLLEDAVVAKRAVRSAILYRIVTAIFLILCVSVTSGWSALLVWGAIRLIW